MSPAYNKQFRLYSALTPLIIGVAAFFLVAGPRVLNPTNIAWLGGGDPLEYYFGWLFYRHTEWALPLGLNPDYGLEISNSILFSDANPLMALLFKPFSSWLPEPFQYGGIWILICFVLQSWFSWKLVGLISNSVLIRSTCVCLFIFSPPMIWRLYGHYSLVAHFLVVAALYFTFHREIKNRTLGWGVLLVATALVHPYILAMIGPIWFAGLLDNSMRGQLQKNRAVKEFFIVIFSVAVTCWQAGYFLIPDGIRAGGFGYFRMNLLSPIDPSGWSYILKDLPEKAGDYEGFNYFGLGVIFLFICSLPALFSQRAKVSGAIGRHKFFCITLIGLVLYAISNKAGFGLYGFNYPLPDFILNATNTFRSSGRMFWPGFYTLIFVAIYFICRGYDQRTALVVVILAAVLQISDTSAGWVTIRDRLMVEPNSTWDAALNDPFWEAAAFKYKNVRGIPVGDRPPNWRTITNYAGTHRLATDIVHIGRISKTALETARNKSTTALEAGTFDSDSLYFLDKRAVLMAFSTVNTTTDLLAEIDGFTVLAPGWKKCGSCPQHIDELSLDSMLYAVPFGEKMPTIKSGSGLPYLYKGWSTPETDRVWSNGQSATILLPLTAKPVTSILIEAIPLVSRLHPKQEIKIFANGTPLLVTALTASSKILIEIEIPESVLELDPDREILSLEFRFPDAARPVDIGINQDQRKLALAVVSFTVR